MNYLDEIANKDFSEEMPSAFQYSCYNSILLSQESNQIMCDSHMGHMCSSFELHPWPYILSSLPSFTIVQVIILMCFKCMFLFLSVLQKCVLSVYVYYLPLDCILFLIPFLATFVPYFFLIHPCCSIVMTFNDAFLFNSCTVLHVGNAVLFS